MMPSLSRKCSDEIDAGGFDFLKEGGEDASGARATLGAAGVRFADADDMGEIDRSVSEMERELGQAGESALEGEGASEGESADAGLGEAEGAEMPIGADE